MHTRTRQILRQLMSHEGISELDLGARTGVNQSTINRFLRGETEHVSFETLWRLAHHFRVTVSELTGETPLSGDRSRQELIRVMEDVPDASRQYFLEAAKALAGALKKSSESAPSGGA